MKQSKETTKKNAHQQRGSAGVRFARLAIMGEQMFHTKDLANLWNIRNPSTLHMTLSRYVVQGLLHRIQRGLYSIKNPAKLDARLIGQKAIHGSAYISCETILFDAGLINQPPQFISIVSVVSRSFSLLGHHYRSRKLADTFLYNDTGIAMKGGVRTATVPRAVADMLYFNPRKHFDVPSAVPWDDVRKIIHTIGYPVSIMKRYATSTQK